MGAVGTHGSCVRTPHGKVAHRMHGIHRFFDRRTEGHIFLGAQNARTYTEFNLLAKRAEDLRAQRCTQIFLGGGHTENIDLHRFFDRST